MTRTWILALAVCAIVLTATSPAAACQGAGPNTHMGVVTAVDPRAKTFTLKDAETGKPIVFGATAEQLQGLKVNDEIAVVYATEKGTLRATSIRKG